MCCVWTILGNYVIQEFIKYFDLLNKRGPDSKNILDLKNIAMCFHRLAIMGLSDAGNQPLKLPNKDIWLTANAEIFNYKDLLENTKPVSDSDCESILYCYDKYGIEETVNKLDGEFAFTLYDRTKETLFVARDPFGVRPLFMGESKDDQTIIFSSEIKGIPDHFTISHVSPGTYMEVSKKDLSVKTTRYYEYIFPNIFNPSMYDSIYNKLVKAVEKRLVADREVGVLLSGGLDSSLVAAIASRKIRQEGGQLHTFSIGMEKGTDLKFARDVARHIGSKHHEVIKTKEEFLKAIPDVVYATESHDVTTIRASVGHYLLAKYIKENTDIKVLLGGEGADEVCGGYLYITKAPNTEEFHKECVRLLENIHLFDVTRSDRCISSQHGLESRVPFLDKDFVKTYLGTLSNHRDGGHKRLLRNVFHKTGLIPVDVILRQKEAFSDGVSPLEDSWHTIIQRHLDTVIPDNEKSEKLTKEQYYYLTLFIKFFGSKNINIIPFHWEPKWTKVKDPSARLL